MITKNNDLKNENKLYKCPECGYVYKEKRWALKCEAWCKKYKSCNLEITKHALVKNTKDIKL